MSHSDPWFDEIYRRNAGKLFKIANHTLRNSAISEEIVQDTFAVLLMKRSEVEQYESVEAFLIDVLRNKVGNELQRAYRKREEPLEDKHAAFAAVEGSRECVADILPDWLSDEERKMLIWRAEENLSFREIARRLGCSEHACHGRMYRLREKFKNFRSQE